VLTVVLLADPSGARATARDEVVTLAGRLASQDRADADVRLTEAINGVVAVTSKHTAPPSANRPDAGCDGAKRDLAGDTAKRSLAASARSVSSMVKVTAASACSSRGIHRSLTARSRYRVARTSASTARTAAAVAACSPAAASAVQCACLARAITGLSQVAAGGLLHTAALG
jgi:hypothetical protein